MPRGGGFTEHDLRQITSKDGYDVAGQFGAGAGAQQVSAGEELLALMIGAVELPAPEREYRFCDRRWRFDFAWPDRKFAVEVEGITHDHGRHQRKEGFERDCEKYEAAMLAGWAVYRVTPSRIKDGTAVRVIGRMLETL